MSPRTGRPPLSEAGSKKTRLDMRLNAEELAMIDDLAEEYGMNRSEIVLYAVRLLAKKKKKQKELH